MSLVENFQAAAVDVKQSLTSKPSNDDLLTLYAHYKQATDGDVSGAQPWAVQLEARAKYDAWAALKGMSKDDAMTKYIAIVADCKTRYM
eukprot:gene5703-6588_t